MSQLQAMQWSADSPVWVVGATKKGHDSVDLVSCDPANRTWLEARVLDPFQVLNQKVLPLKRVAIAPSVVVSKRQSL